MSLSTGASPDETSYKPTTSRNWHQFRFRLDLRSELDRWRNRRPLCTRRNWSRTRSRARGRSGRSQRRHWRRNRGSRRGRHTRRGVSCERNRDVDRSALRLTRAPSPVITHGVQSVKLYGQPFTTSVLDSRHRRARRRLPQKSPHFLALLAMTGPSIRRCGHPSRA